jgi:hypothetical protein
MEIFLSWLWSARIDLLGLGAVFLKLLPLIRRRLADTGFPAIRARIHLPGSLEDKTAFVASINHGKHLIVSQAPI